MPATPTSAGSCGRAARVSVSIELPPARVRSLLIQYIDEANDLAVQPRFYNTLTTNCTTTIFDMMRAVTSSIPFDWRIILTGYLPRRLMHEGPVALNIVVFAKRLCGSARGRER